MNFIQKLLIFLTFLSRNEVWQKYKKLFLEWLSKYMSKKQETVEQKEENLMSVYPETLPLESIKYLVANRSTLTESLPDATYHGYLVLGYLLSVTVGQPSSVKTFSSEPLNEEVLAELYALEDVEPAFGSDKAGMDPATIIMIIQGILSLLRMLGIGKNAKTSDVID
jgi:hypothetical protein